MAPSAIAEKKKPKNAPLLTPAGLMLMFGMAMLVPPKQEKESFGEDEWGFISLGPIISLVGAVILTVIVLLVLNALAPDFITAVADLTSTIANSEWNNTIANAIADVVAILIPLGGIFALTGLIFAALEFGRRSLLPNGY